MSDEKKKAMADESEEDERDEELEKEIDRDEKEKQAAQKPAGPVGPNVAFNHGSRVALVLTAFALAATVYFLPLPDFFLTKPLVQEPKLTGMIVVAAALFAAALWAGFRFFGGLLDYAKPGQGYWVRTVGYASFGVMGAFAAISLHGSLYQALPSASDYLQTLWSTSIIGYEVTLRPIFFPSIATGLLLLMAYHFFMNRAKWVDFLIETQSEVRRVSWPARKEWVGSSIVVVIVVAFISVFLYLVDSGLSVALQKLRIGF
jgi:preprotein translocase subunit SecE